MHGVIDSVHALQETIVDAIWTCVDAGGEVVPSLWETPLVEGVPAPRSVCERVFALTHKLLDAQRDHLKRMITDVDDELGQLAR